MGSHNQVQRPRGQGRPAVSLLGGGHGAHQKPHPKACPRQKGFHGPLMLLGQQLRGGHQRRLTAVFRAEVYAGGGHHGLAGTHVSLTEPVHGLPGGHVGNGLVHAAALGTCQDKGEGIIKRRHIHRAERLHGHGFPPGSQQLQPNGEKE